MRTKLLLLFFVSFIFINHTISQNSNWILSPFNYEINAGFTPLGLPVPQYFYGDPNIPLTPGDYSAYEGMLAGQTASNASNIITDPNNEIFFYIIDEYIYEKHGYCIGVLSYTPSFIISPDFKHVEGGSEILVVPNPDNCDQFYIISVFMDADSGNKSPWIFLLDMSKPNQEACSFSPEETVFGQLVPIGLPGSSGGQNVGLKINPSGFENLNGITSNIHLGATKDKFGNFYHVFISNDFGIYQFILNGNGLSFSNNNLTFGSINFDPDDMTDTRSEMEVCKLPNGNFRIACPYKKTQTIGGNQAWEFLYVAEFNSAGLISEFHFPFFKTPGIENQYIALKGLEFSQNGNILYITHTVYDENILQPNQMEYFDFSNPAIGLTPLLIDPNKEAQFSVLEIDQNGSIYFNGQNGMYKIPFANNPNTNLQQVLPGPGFYNFGFNGSGGPNSDLHKLYILQDQIDDLNYTEEIFSPLQCCVNNKNFEINHFTTSSNESWSPNSPTSFTNSLPSTVRIKNELRVKAGTTLTLNNLIFEFAPEARLIVENGDGINPGGKLILNNTTLTVDDRCEPNGLLWYGVEVWGHSNQVQGTFLSSNQGRFEMRNNSRIEKAWMGILVGKRNSNVIETCLDYTEEEIDPFLFDDSKTGGIIRILPGSVLKNNQRGIRFRPYQNAGYNNVSVINNTDFEWDGNNLVGIYNVQAHIQLEGVKGITIRGCRFKNFTSDFTQPVINGIGVLSRASQFTVTDYCNTFIPPFAPCQNPVKTVFTNLSFGIHASNPLDNFTFQVEKSEFDNCARGVYAVSTRNERIVRNVFKIRQSTYQTVGIYLERSTGYTVQENDLGGKSTPLGLDQVRSYGIVADNSGTLNNLIYKNRIGQMVDNVQSKLYIGTYSIKLNGSNVPLSVWQTGDPAASTGLLYRCNRYIRDIYMSDFAVNGIINYNQGNSVLEIPAANSFETPFNGMLEHDITMNPSSQGIRYFIQITPLNNIPIYYTNPNYVHLDLLTSQFNESKTCPSLLGKPINLVIGDYQSSINEVNSYQIKMKGGDALSQLMAIQSSPSSIDTRNLLVQNSPFLTDEVLLSYLNSTASAGSKKDVLIANTSLSEVIMQAVNASNLPQGTKNQIVSAQNSSNQKEEIIELYNYHHFEMDRNYNEALSRLLLDTSESMNYTEVIAFLNQSNDRNSKKILVDIYLSKGDLLEMELVKSSLATDDELELDYFLLQDLKEQVRQYTSIEEAMENTEVSEPIEDLALNSTDVYIKGKSIAFLESKTGPKDIEELPPVQSTMMLIQQQDEVSSNYETHEIVQIYPNPSTGMVFFDYPEHKEGIISIQLMDLSGKLVHSYNSQSASNGERVDLSAIKKGIYLVRVCIDGVYIETHKLLLK